MKLKVNVGNKRHKKAHGTGNTEKLQKLNKITDQSHEDADTASRAETEAETKDGQTDRDRSKTHRQ